MIRYDFGGVIASADPSTGVTPGTRFSGSFTFDPTDPTSPLITIEGSNQYLFGRSENVPNSVADGSGLTLQVGGKTVLADPGGVQVSVNELESPGQFGYQDANGPCRPVHETEHLEREYRRDASGQPRVGEPDEVGLRLARLRRRSACPTSRRPPST